MLDLPLSILKRSLGAVGPDPRWFAVEDPCGREQAHATLTYLGTAGFVLATPERTVVLDPFVSRRGLRDTLVSPLVVDDALGARLVPRADDVLVGHAHFDHVLDAPAICRRTGARLVGSDSVRMIGLAAGMSDADIVVTRGREDIACGPVTVRGIPSVHAKLVFGRAPLPGHLRTPPRWPPRAKDLPHGDVLNWVVDTGRLRIGHIDSADFLAHELHGNPVDVLCLCAVGRHLRPGYTRDAISIMKPRWVVPCHWDTMITAVDAPSELLPGVDLPGFFREIREAGAEPLPVPLLGELRFPAVR